MLQCPRIKHSDHIVGGCNISMEHNWFSSMRPPKNKCSKYNYFFLCKTYWVWLTVVPPPRARSEMSLSFSLYDLLGLVDGGATYQGAW